MLQHPRQLLRGFPSPELLLQLEIFANSDDSSRPMTLVDSTVSMFEALPYSPHMVAVAKVEFLRPDGPLQILCRIDESVALTDWGHQVLVIVVRLLIDDQTASPESLVHCPDQRRQVLDDVNRRFRRGGRTGPLGIGRSTCNNVSMRINGRGHTLRPIEGLLASPGNSVSNA